jgi:hypothetical protein
MEMGWEVEVESYVFVEGVLDWHREREFGLAFFFFG